MPRAMNSDFAGQANHLSDLVVGPLAATVAESPPSFEGGYSATFDSRRNRRVFMPCSDTSRRPS